MGKITTEDVIGMLGLEPLPGEGGWFRETYRASGRIASPMGERCWSTQIYYLLRSGSVSRLHRVRSDEVFHHYMGAAVTQLIVPDSGAPSVVTIGQDLASGERPQSVVPADAWQGALLSADLDGSPDASAWALMGCTVSPGFEWDDFEMIEGEPPEGLRDRAGPHGELFDRLVG